MAERQILQDAIGVGLINHDASAQTAATLGVLGLQQVAFAGMGTLDFAGPGDLKAFGHRFSRFDAFWTSHIY